MINIKRRLNSKLSMLAIQWYKQTKKNKNFINPIRTESENRKKCLKKTRKKKSQKKEKDGPFLATSVVFLGAIRVTVRVGRPPVQIGKCPNSSDSTFGRFLVLRRHCCYLTRERKKERNRERAILILDLTDQLMCASVTYNLFNALQKRVFKIFQTWDVIEWGRSHRLFTELS